jgi:hypothetical protein
MPVSLNAYSVSAVICAPSGNELVMPGLDYISCVLTVISTVLVGKKLWHGWVVAAANSVIICFIGMRTAQFGFVPANLFCMGLYANNLWSWRCKKP